MIAMGFALVRSGVIRSKDCLGLSVVTLNIICPCMNITAFQVDFTPEVRTGFLLALVAGIVVQLVFWGLSELFGKFLHFDAVEKTSAIYSNCGNLVIPLVVSLLGSQWVIYTMAYTVFQTFLIWSHGKATLAGRNSVDFRHMFFSINMLSIYVGIVLLLTGWRLPGPLYDAVSAVGNMIGPISMLITGIIMGGMSFKEIFGRKRLIYPVLFRLVVFPLITVALLKFTGIASFSPIGTSVLLITLLAASAPAASTLNQMAQIYDRDAGYASSINVVSTLCCIVTMPIMVALYLM